MWLVQFLERRVLVVLIYGLTLALFPWLLAWVIFKRYFGGFFGLGAKTWDAPPDILQDDKWGQHSYAHLKNVKLHYVEKGNRNRPLLLLLHGFPEFWYSWRYQLADLSDTHWVVAVDLRGYGESDKPSGVENYRVDVLVEDIRQLILHLGKQQCVVAGHDWGGFLAWSMAIKFPDMVDRLIILNCPHPAAFMRVKAESYKQVLMSWYMTFFQIPYVPEMYLWSSLSIMFQKAFWVTAEGKKQISLKDIEAFQYTYSLPGAFTCPINYYRAMHLGPSSATKDNLQVIPRTLIIWGMKDKYLTSSLAFLSGEYVRQNSLRPIESASHWVQQDHPQLVNKHIREFLAKE